MLESREIFDKSDVRSNALTLGASRFCYVLWFEGGMNLQLCNSPTLLAVGYAAAQPLTRRVNAQVVYPHESPNICTQSLA